MTPVLLYYVKEDRGHGLLSHASGAQKILSESF